jgi:hypothetical protein
MEVIGQCQAPAALPGERFLDTQCTRGWVGRKDGMNTEATQLTSMTLRTIISAM